MKFSRWNYPLVAVTIVGLFVQMTGVSAAVVSKPGARCKAVGSKASSKAGQNLVCAKNGKKLVWKVSAVSTKLPPIPKPSPTPSPSTSQAATPDPATSSTPSPTISIISGPISADCIAMLVKIGASMDSGGMTFTSDGMDAMGKCQKDTGITEIITSAPFNPANIVSITKFRSCAGHDFAEGSGDGQILNKDPQYEKFSSMKHYVTTVKQNAGDTTEVFAPFDGVITRVGSESNKQSNGGSYANAGNQIDLVPYANPSITFTFMHVYGTTFKPGDAVIAGQKVAYHEVQGLNVGHSSFDIVMSRADMQAMLARASRKLSMMNYLTQSVSTQFDKVGLTRENSIWSAVYRTANPCVLVGNQGFFQGPENPADRVILKH